MTSPKPQTTILFLTADPSNASRLRLGQELREIQNRLKLAKQGDLFSLVERMSVRPGDITQAIFDTEPQIIHFSGHGLNTGELCFEDENGQAHTVQPDALASLFKLLSNQIQCIVLNACYSEIQAKSIAQHIDFVIGMKEEIGEQGAIAFSTGFYKALGAGHSVEGAYDFGIVELKLFGIKEHFKPVLYKKKVLRLPHVLLNESNSSLSKSLDYASFEVNLGPGKDNKVVLMSPNAYQSIETMLDDLFLHYLSPLVPPYTYGSQWILRGGISDSHILAPLEWISKAGQPIRKLAPTWSSSTSPDHQDIKPRTQWEVITRTGATQDSFRSIIDEGVYGIISNNKMLIQKLSSNVKKIYLFHEKRYFNYPSTEEVDFSKYRFKYVFHDWFGIGLKGLILEDTGKPLNKEDSLF